jgi:hypothetical protein
MEQQPGRPPSADAVPIDFPAMWQTWLRAFGLRGPLSGDVNQAIDASLLHAMADQLGFININGTRAGDVQLEQRITEQVASYGRQLGWVVDALEVLIRTERPADLTPDDAAALDQVRTLRPKSRGQRRRSPGIASTASLPTYRPCGGIRSATAVNSSDCGEPSRATEGPAVGRRPARWRDG